MSRSGYYDDDGCEDTWAHIRWRGAVKSAMRGKKGQAFLKEALAALEAMPEKKLAANTYEAEGAYCTLGVVGKQRGIDLSGFDDEYFDENYAEHFGVNSKVLREIIWENDGYSGKYVNHQFVGRYETREKFGPPKYLAFRNRTWNAEKQGWDEAMLTAYSPCEIMTYEVEREEFAYERWQYMHNWLTNQIIKEEND